MSLGDFEQLRRATITFVMSGRLSVRPSVPSSAHMELCSRWTDFPEVLY